MVITSIFQEYLKKHGYLEEKKTPIGRRGAGTPNLKLTASSSFTIDRTDGWEDVLLTEPSRADVVEFTEEQLKTAFKNFQKFHNLKETGVLDSDTLKRIEAPRCGVKDEIQVPQKKIHSKSRRKRFTLQGSKWPHHNITYNITRYSKKLSHAETDAAFKDAFRKWAEVSPLVFRWSSDAMIRISFVEGKFVFCKLATTSAHVYFLFHQKLSLFFHTLTTRPIVSKSKS